MKSKWWILSTGVVLSVGVAQEKGALTKDELAEQLPGVEASEISDSPVDGLYQVAVGTSVAYVSNDGRYVLHGELYDLDTSENLTERIRARARVAMLAEVDEGSKIVFSPEGEVKHRVTIFTDIDCGYCRQFHREIDKVNALGIEVQYLFFPRTGPETESWAKAERVWCAEDRHLALTRAKLGGTLPDKSCGDTPVQEHYDLGNRVGVRGTPAIFSERGELVGGYLPPAQLLKALESPTLGAE